MSDTPGDPRPRSADGSSSALARLRRRELKRDTIRCLKRYLARELYNDIQAIIATTKPRSNIAA